MAKVTLSKNFKKYTGTPPPNDHRFYLTNRFGETIFSHCPIHRDPEKVSQAQHDSFKLIVQASAKADADLKDPVKHDEWRRQWNASFAQRTAKHYKTLRGFVIAAYRKQLKAILPLFLVFIGALGTLSAKPSSAVQFATDGIWYETINSRQVRIIADPTDSLYRLMDTISIPVSIDYNGKKYQVSEIGDQAFRYCHLLRQISLPDNLRKIGYQSFMNCTQLAEIHLPGSLRKIDEMAFYGCASLKTVYVGKHIKKWPDMCFSDCTSLQSIWHAARRAPRSHPMTFFNCSDSITYYRLR